MPSKTKDCPLPPSLIHLLQACVQARSTKDRDLAEHLQLSPATIRTKFKRIGEVLGTHDRFASILIAVEHGWIVLPLPPSTESRMTETP